MEGHACVAALMFANMFAKYLKGIPEGTKEILNVYTVTFKLSVTQSLKFKDCICRPARPSIDLARPIGSTSRKGWLWRKMRTSSTNYIHSGDPARTRSTWQNNSTRYGGVTSEQGRPGAQAAGGLFGGSLSGRAAGQLVSLGTGMYICMLYIYAICTCVDM